MFIMLTKAILYKKLSTPIRWW